MEGRSATGNKGERKLEDILNILVATDLHLGYKELDPVRGNDSFNTFEEILQLAKEHDVDFILLGGDLFHDAKPSPSCLLKCTTLFRKYCFGNKSVEIEILSDQHENFKESIMNCVNYEDPNLNISYPVFSIHGNHDDPVGKDAISSLDIFSRMGLVNYFGKWPTYDQITVSPVLIRKGLTNLALYGLSFLKDQRLARLFNEGKVKIEKLASSEEWFNIFTLHQNRADRGYLNHIPEDVLPEFMDLIIWGHEHDCRIEPEWNGDKNFFVCQPGSPVATSLAYGESLPKHCGLLQIHKTNFELHPLKLQTVRPFIFETIVLSEEKLDPMTVNKHEQAQDYLKGRVETALEKAEELLTGHERQPALPLIRLNVFYEHDSQQFNVIRFGQQFSDAVANPQDMLLLKREKVRDKKYVKTELDKEALDNFAGQEENNQLTVESLLEQYYAEQPEDKQLKMLSVKHLGEAVTTFRQKGCNEAISDLIQKQTEKYMEFLKKTDALTEHDVLDQISIAKQELFGDPKSEVFVKLSETIKTSEPKTKKNAKTVTITIDSDDSDDPSENSNTSSPTKSVAAAVTARGRGRGSRGGRGSRARGKVTTAPALNITRESRSSAVVPSLSNWLSSNNSSQSSTTRRQNSTQNSSKRFMYDDSD